MIRLVEIKDLYVHKCVQCGLEITYQKYGHAYCPICKASQRLRSADRKTDVPFDFILNDGKFARVMYHTRDTRPS